MKSCCRYCNNNNKYKYNKSITLTQYVKSDYTVSCNCESKNRSIKYVTLEGLLYYIINATMHQKRKTFFENNE